MVTFLTIILMTRKPTDWTLYIHFSIIKLVDFSGCTNATVRRCTSSEGGQLKNNYDNALTGAGDGGKPELRGQLCLADALRCVYVGGKGLLGRRGYRCGRYRGGEWRVIFFSFVMVQIFSTLKDPDLVKTKIWISFGSLANSDEYVYRTLNHLLTAGERKPVEKVVVF